MRYKVTEFYDRSLRLWTCLWIDEQGNQNGEAQYAPRRDEKDRLVDRMENHEPVDYQV